MKIICILQPGYLPWLGFFEQMLRCRQFVIYDDVQYDKHGWRNRNRIKGPRGPEWLTAPVVAKGGPKLINQVEIDSTQPRWARKHLAALRQHYGKAPYFKDYFPALEETLSRKWRRLVELDMEIIKMMARWLGLRSELLLSSELGIPRSDPNKRLVDILHRLDGKVFYEGAAGKNYLNLDMFRRNGLQVVFQDYQPRPYPQQYQDQGFVPFLSAIDLLFNCGPESPRYLPGLNPPDLHPVGAKA